MSVAAGLMATFANAFKDIELIWSEASAYNNTNSVITLPGTLKEGDLVVFSTVVDAESTGLFFPSDQSDVLWSRTGGIRLWWSNDSQLASAVYLKKMGSTPDTQIKIGDVWAAPTYDHQATVTMVFRNVDKVTPVDVLPQTATGATGDPDSPSITTITDKCVALSFGWLDDDIVTSVTAPSGYENLLWVNGGGIAEQSENIMVSTKYLPTAGAENPGAYVTNGDDLWYSLTMALRPHYGRTGGNPTIQGSANARGTRLTSQAVTFSPAPAAGDLILVFGTTDNGSWQTFTGGYDQVYSDNGMGIGETIHVKESDGTETTFTASNSAFSLTDATVLIAVIMRGAKIIDRATAGGDPGMPNPPALYMKAGDISLIVGHLDDDAITMTAPSGYTLIDAVNANYASLTNACSMGVAYKVITTDGVEDPGVFGGGGTDTWVATTLRIR